MVIDTHFFHDVCIAVLYGSAAMLAFVLVERFVYFSLLNGRAARLHRVLDGTKAHLAERTLRRRDILSRSIARYVAAAASPEVARHSLEDLSSALYIETSGRIGARLWLLDTIVTAAPLLGLLGTILGIMDTFNALSSGGISDPSAVSRGIAAALVATAIGIGVALFGLLGYNLLHRMSEHLIERFKALILLCDGFVASGIGHAGRSAATTDAAAHAEQAQRPAFAP